MTNNHECIQCRKVECGTLPGLYPYWHSITSGAIDPGHDGIEIVERDEGRFCSWKCAGEYCLKQAKRWD